MDRFADSSELDELLHSFQTGDDLGVHFSIELRSGGPTFVLDLSEMSQPRTIETINAELDQAGDEAAAANRREFVLASEALAATIKEGYPDARELEIEDSATAKDPPTTPRPASWAAAVKRYGLPTQTTPMESSPIPSPSTRNCWTGLTRHRSP